MSVASTIFDLFDHHRWAMAKVFERCQPLSEAQWDTQFPIGFGSLRATLAHMWGAERLWLDRWRGESPGEFPSLPHVSLAELIKGFDLVDCERSDFFSTLASPDWSQEIVYRNLAGDSFSHALADLALHVANHAVHHRAQLLQLLRRQEITQPGGLDYIFYRMAFPTVPLAVEVVATGRQYGLEVGDQAVVAPEYSPELLHRYASYGDWAIDRIFQFALHLAAEELDREFPMGRGSLRKTLLHLLDAERWWQGNWQGTTLPFPHSPTAASLHEVQKAWHSIAKHRTQMLDELGAMGLQRVVSASVGAGVWQFRVGESLLQLSVHGTLHRAQALNMLRQLGYEPPGLDFVLWLRQEGGR